MGLPHARGGVSGTTGSTRQKKLVFPTPVGVFLARPRAQRSGSGLPHARGGVSMTKIIGYNLIASSPRPWGCFSSGINDLLCYVVFPTPVGVFPAVPIQPWATASLPHARGGVSYARIDSFIYRVSSPRPWGCFFRHVLA